MLLLAQINAFERRVQRAAPGSYPMLATFFFVIGFFPLIFLLMSFVDGPPIHDISTNIMRLLLACITLLCFHVGRLAPILVIRLFSAPFLPGAPTWTRILAASSILFRVTTLFVDEVFPEFRPSLLSNEGFLTVRMVWISAFVVAGAAAQKAQGRMEAQRSDIVPRTISENAGKPDVPAQPGNSEELSVVDRAMLDMHKSEYEESGGILTVQDLRLAIVGWIASECFWGYLFYISCSALRDTLRQSKATEKVPRSTIYTMALPVGITGVVLLLVPLSAVRRYLKYKGRQMVKVAHEDSTPVETEDAEKQ